MGLLNLDQETAFGSGEASSVLAAGEQEKPRVCGNQDQTPPPNHWPLYPTPERMEANGGCAEWSPPPMPVATPAPAPMHQMPMMTPPLPPQPPPPASQTAKECFEESVAGAEDASNKVPLCSGCRLRITDEFFLNAVERKWHLNCLKCVECGVELEGQKSCFMKNGSIFCKEDFLRIFDKKCARCFRDISGLVIRAKNCLFHPDCFSCTMCEAVLRKGDFYAIVDDRLYCQKHYERVQNLQPPPQPHPPYPTPPSNQPHLPPHGFHPHHPMQLAMGPHDDPGMFPYPPGGGADYPHPQFEPGWFPPPPPGAEYMPGMHGPHPPPGAEFSPFENNNEPKKKRPGRKRRPKVNAEAAAFAAMNGYSGSVEGAYPPGMDGGAAGKAKRARTSFKHHQLRIMKAHFQINQNPDSRELKMLSQKTNLDKKVLQVWFQNARAKWRRTKAQDGSGGTVPPGPLSTGSSDDCGTMMQGLESSGGGELGSPTMSDCGDAMSNAMISCC